MAIFIVRSAETGPQTLPASSKAVALVSFKTFIFLILLFSVKYDSILTPWESMPRRLPEMSTFATTSAWSSDAPEAWTLSIPSFLHAFEETREQTHRCLWGGL